MIKNIAITGSYAAGKTHLLILLKECGYKVFSCDEHVKKLYKTEEVKDKILQNVLEIKDFDKKKIANLIFDNSEIRAKIENILHPIILEKITHFENENKGENFIFTEVPLLFEKKLEGLFFKTLVVFCSEEERLMRAKERGVDEDFFEKINKIQISQKEKIKLADFKISSQQNNKEMLQQLKQIMSELK